MLSPSSNLTPHSSAQNPHNRHHDHFQGAFLALPHATGLRARSASTSSAGRQRVLHAAKSFAGHFSLTLVSRTSSPTTRSSPTPTTSSSSTTSSTRPTARRSPSVVRPSVCRPTKHRYVTRGRGANSAQTPVPTLPPRRLRRLSMTLPSRSTTLSTPSASQAPLSTRRGILLISRVRNDDVLILLYWLPNSHHGTPFVNSY